MKITHLHATSGEEAPVDLDRAHVRARRTVPVARVGPARRHVPDGQDAARTQVKLGRTSVSTVEILSGLREGDQVIISDTSSMDNYNQIRLR